MNKLSHTHKSSSYLLYLYICAAHSLFSFHLTVFSFPCMHLPPRVGICFLSVNIRLWKHISGRQRACVLIMYHRWTTAGHTKPGFSVRRQEADAGISEYYVTAKRYLATQNQDGWERDRDLMKDEPLNLNKTIKKSSKVQLQLHY